MSEVRNIRRITTYDAGIPYTNNVQVNNTDAIQVNGADPVYCNTYSYKKYSYHNIYTMNNFTHDTLPPVQFHSESGFTLSI